MPVRLAIEQPFRGGRAGDETLRHAPFVPDAGECAEFFFDGRVVTEPLKLAPLSGANVYICLQHIGRDRLHGGIGSKQPFQMGQVDVFGIASIRLFGSFRQMGAVVLEKLAERDTLFDDRAMIQLSAREQEDAEIGAFGQFEQAPFEKPEVFFQAIKT